MGLLYSATIFYGTYVTLDSVLGKKLDKYIAKHEGSPAPCGVRGVEICSVGWLNNSPQWITIQAKGTRRTIYAGDEIQKPSAINENVAKADLVRHFIHRIGASDVKLPRIGWHLAGCVS